MSPDLTPIPGAPGYFLDVDNQQPYGVSGKKLTLGGENSTRFQIVIGGSKRNVTVHRALMAIKLGVSVLEVSHEHTKTGITFAMVPPAYHETLYEQGLRQWDTLRFPAPGGAVLSAFSPLVCPVM